MKDEMIENLRCLNCGGDLAPVDKKQMSYLCNHCGGQFERAVDASLSVSGLLMKKQAEEIALQLDNPIFSDLKDRVLSGEMSDDEVRYEISDRQEMIGRACKIFWMINPNVTTNPLTGCDSWEDANSLMFFICDEASMELGNLVELSDDGVRIVESWNKPRERERSKIEETREFIERKYIERMEESQTNNNFDYIIKIIIFLFIMWFLQSSWWV